MYVPSLLLLRLGCLRSRPGHAPLLHEARGEMYTVLGICEIEFNPRAMMLFMEGVERALDENADIPSAVKEEMVHTFL